MTAWADTPVLARGVRVWVASELMSGTIVARIAGTSRYVVKLANGNVADYDRQDLEVWA